MKNTKTINKPLAQTQENSTAEISKVAVTAFSVIAALIGLWAVACMVAGISNSGGPASLLSNLLQAIIG
jgi:hypothetical protein